MQRCPTANQIDDPDQRTAARGAFDVNDLVPVADTEVDGFADCFVQLLHERQGDLADVEARLDDVAQFEQTDAQCVGARVVSFDKARVGHHREDAMCRGWVQPGGCRQCFERRRSRRVGQGIEQRHHAFDDLDRSFGFGCFRHGFPVVSFCFIP